jgi:hypothetical protein
MSKRSKLLTQVGSVAALCFMFIGFQNCGKQMQFSASGLENSLKDSTLVKVPVDEGTDDVVDNPVDDSGNVDEGNPADNPPGDVVDDPVDQQPELPPPSVITDDNSGEVDGEPDSGPQNFICIIAGHGKSQKLALVDNNLVSQTSACKTVCTTQKGCLDIASQKFDVVSAEFRGFCKQESDHHSVHLSAEQLQEVINNSN